MSMSRKHYISIADRFWDQFELRLNHRRRNHQPSTFEVSKQDIAELLASCLVGTNPRFDRGRFVRRCMQGCSDSQFERSCKRARRVMLQKQATARANAVSAAWVAKRD